MPVAVSYPGVYIEEIPSGVRTIVGVATSIAAFVDFFAQGPMNDATRVLSFADFERERIKERIQVGLQRAKRQGQRLGRRRQRIAPEALQRVHGLSVRQAAKALGVPASRVHRERERVEVRP